MNGRVIEFILKVWTGIRGWVDLSAGYETHPRLWKYRYDLKRWGTLILIGQGTSRRDRWIAFCRWLGCLGHTHQWKLDHCWNTRWSDFRCTVCGAEKTDATPPHEARRIISASQYSDRSVTELKP